MSLNNELKLTLLKKDFAQATKILAKRPLLAKKADINLVQLDTGRGLDQTTPLLLWTYNKEVDAVKWALAHGANPNMTEINETQFGIIVKGLSPLCAIIVFWRMQNSSADLDKCIAIVEALLAFGADVNFINGAGYPLFNLACYNAPGSDPHFLKTRENLVHLLLKSGANPKVKTKDGFTPLHSLCFLHVESSQHIIANQRLIDLLLEAGVDANARDYMGSTPLHKAMSSNIGTAETGVYLCKLGKLDVNAIDNYGRSALNYAASNGFHEGAKLLLENGADPLLPDAEGKTPFNISLEKKDKDNDTKTQLPSHHNYATCYEIIKNAIK